MDDDDYIRGLLDDLILLVAEREHSTGKGRWQFLSGEIERLKSEIIMTAAPDEDYLGDVDPMTAALEQIAELQPPRAKEAQRIAREALEAA